MNVTVVISMGDYNGIGPEVILKSFRQPVSENTTPVILGRPEVFEFYARTIDDTPEFKLIDSIREAVAGTLNLLPCCNDSVIELNPGSVSGRAGLAAMNAVETGIEACLSGKADALVTAPISKEAIHLAGYTVPGHTEFLAEKSGTQDYMMILASGSLRVGLATGHIPVRRIPEELSKMLIISKLKSLHNSLKNDFGIDQPKIAVFGLNPHAGDGGVLGSEENDIIIPALHEATKMGFQTDGPFPADGFFGSGLHREYDGILAMYHDQGLVPFKALSFGSGVNFTAGLPFVRTSPDHGTAFGIAGLNRADERSFHEAFRLAVELATNRMCSETGEG